MIGVGPTPTPDAEFFYTLHTLEVDGVLFRVPGHLLAPSQFFHGLLYMSTNARSRTAPSADSRAPHRLPNVTVEEFKDFYRVLEAAPYRWTFSDLREIAITHIEHHEDCVLRLNIARRYGIHRLLPEALRELAERDEPLRHLEHELLGSKLAAHVMQYREARWRADVEPDTEEWRRSHIAPIFGVDFARDWEAGIVDSTQ